jgi:hypothetical protein
VSVLVFTVSLIVACGASVWLAFIFRDINRRPRRYTFHQLMFLLVAANIGPTIAVAVLLTSRHPWERLLAVPALVIQIAITIAFAARFWWLYSRST